MQTYIYKTSVNIGYVIDYVIKYTLAAVHAFSFVHDRHIYSLLELRFSNWPFTIFYH